MKLVYQYIVIFFNFSPTSNHLHPLQVENCDSNSRLVVDEDDNVKSEVKGLIFVLLIYQLIDFVIYNMKWPMPRKPTANYILLFIEISQIESFDQLRIHHKVF